LEVVVVVLSADVDIAVAAAGVSGPNPKRIAMGWSMRRMISVSPFASLPSLTVSFCEMPSVVLTTNPLISMAAPGVSEPLASWVGFSRAVSDCYLCLGRGRILLLRKGAVPTCLLVEAMTWDLVSFSVAFLGMHSMSMVVAMPFSLSDVRRSGTWTGRHRGAEKKRREQ